MAEIVRRHGATVNAVRRCARRHGLARSDGAPRHALTVPQQEVVLTLRQQGLSQNAIALATGHSQTVVGRICRANGLGVVEMAYDRSPHWRGGRTKHGSGYWQVMVAPDDPMRVMATRSGYVSEHRLVMARALGRPLVKSETVHHINGDVVDNRLCNLQLRQGNHGKGVIMLCNHCGSTDVAAASITED